MVKKSCERELIRQIIVLGAAYLKGGEAAGCHGGVSGGEHYLEKKFEKKGQLLGCQTTKKTEQKGWGVG